MHHIAQFTRLRGPLAGDRTAQILHTLLLVIAVWTAASSITTLPFAPITFPRIALVAILEVSLAAALVVLRFGQFRRASIIHLAGIWLWATLIFVFFGGLPSTGMVLYVSLPISAAWLLGYRAALWTASGCLLSALVFAVLDMVSGTLPNPVTGTPLGRWAVLVQATLINAIPVGQIIGRLRETLEELRQYQGRLELLVQQRTNELVQARDQAEAANRAKSAFLAKMSHELRTPLNAILGFSNLLLEHNHSAAQRRDLDIISRSGEHLLTLINEILDVAKIEAGRTELKIAPCDLTALVKDIADLMRVRIAEKRLKLLLVSSGESPAYAYVDAAKLRAVLINLLGNAIKYTEHGSITLRLDAGRLDEAERLLLRFSVEDTGIGIAPEDHERIFKPFEQVARAGRQKGTGLGLAITRQMVELMGGTVTVGSSLDKGSCFRVELLVPRAREAEAIPEMTRGLSRIPRLEHGQPEYRILIVEDQPENWMVLERLLTKAGFQVRVAEDGKQGVECFSEWRPHFIWMDLRMPVMGGIEAAQQIRHLDGGRDVKIVAVSASGFDSRRREVLAAGLDDYVRKPYRASEIFDCMAHHLEIRYIPCEPASVLRSETAELNPHAIAGLPAALRVELRNALVALDTERISQTVKKIAAQDAALAEVLLRHTESFSYTTILRAVGNDPADSQASVL